MKTRPCTYEVRPGLRCRHHASPGCDFCVHHRRMAGHAAKRARVLAAAAEGKSVAELAAEFCLHPGTVRKYLREAKDA